jgi:hypothetical protein
MFDNNSFTRSELYFATLQLLRISSEWIRGSMEDLESLAQGTEIYLFEIQAYLRPERDDHDPTTANVARVLRQNWKNVLAHQKRLGKPLLDRIEKKTEEVKSLRDGVGLSSQALTSIIYANNSSSSSTQRQCEKRQGVQHSTTIS